MKPWAYLSNQFLVATEDSYRDARKLGLFTTAALQAKSSDAFFNDLYNTLLPVYNNFITAYDNWLAQKGLQKGKTASLKQLIHQLSNPNIEDWDIAIQSVYKQGTPQYISLLPQHRTPFQTGPQNTRIAAVDALIKAIGSDAALASLKTTIAAFYVQLVAANNIQKGSKSTTTDNSDAVVAARIALCVELYGVLGALMQHFKTNPGNAAAYFDLETLRNPQQTTFKHNLKAGETMLALTHTFEESEQVRIINRGNTDLRFGLTTEKNDFLPEGYVLITALNEQLVPVEELGKIHSQRFLKAVNTSATQEGAYTIELI